MIRVDVTIADTETGEQKSFTHDYEEPPMLIAIENPSVELGLSMTDTGPDSGYDEWQRRFYGSEFNLLNRNMGES